MDGERTELLVIIDQCHPQCLVKVKWYYWWHLNYTGNVLFMIIMSKFMSFMSLRSASNFFWHKLALGFWGLFLNNVNQKLCPQNLLEVAHNSISPSPFPLDCWTSLVNGPPIERKCIDVSTWFIDFDDDWYHLTA